MCFFENQQISKTHKMQTFNSILENFRKQAYSERDKGDKFERLMLRYLQTDPIYKDRFTDVWLWSEFPCQTDFAGGKDLGIDIVCRTKSGDYWAVQCKFYDQDTPITKEDVDTFLSTSGKQFTDSITGQTTQFAERLWISTTDNWSGNAIKTIRNQQPQVNKIGLAILADAAVDWEQLASGISGKKAQQSKKTIREHQQKALECTHEHFKEADRGKLIMACGTGKTFTSLKIAEHETEGKGLILFLVPSIALLGQTLREWSAQSDKPINSVCICSDSTASQTKAQREDKSGDTIEDLMLPASTNVETILHQFNQIKDYDCGGMTVVFSTYQSIERIAEAQEVLLSNDYPQFDLIICDEAHRTTGVTLRDDTDESSFVKVHKNDFIKAKKRLYMTATPKLYGDDAKLKADEMEAVLCSMDDESLYGGEVYSIGFGKAVQKGLLCDYKVLILTVSEDDVPKAVQEMVADKATEINSTDAAKLIGCINALSKQVLGDEDMIKNSDPEPMRRAVAFCQTIKASQMITKAFQATQDKYLEDLPQERRQEIVNIIPEHIDGTMGAEKREKKLLWLKGGNADANECRVLTNVRCLSEGVDVPTLDAVMFLSPRNSQVEVVQSVGRVMRTAEGKKYGYIIIPVVVPSNVEANVALDKNESFKVVWEVLNALRSHDDRFNATINKIDLNRKKPDNILVGRPASRDRDDFPNKGNAKESAEYARQLVLAYEPLQSVIYGKIVKKVGQRRYWELWAKDVAEIAQRYSDRIQRLINEDNKHRKAFDDFLKGLQKNINPSITIGEAIDMLSQHIITKPVFEALFDDYSFVRNNAISVSMQKMLDLLEEQSLEKDAQTLEKFYTSVKERASGIDNADAKQKIIVELYDKFFKTAFPKMVEKLGIVYTPVEVVDFIIKSVEVVLNKEFGRSVSDENVHILDPFTGTGTFITRLLQSGLIHPEDLHRKYTRELHANEIVLLAYYIAAINIENAYHDLAGTTDFVSFDGICLTDTFQLGETDSSEKLFSEMFPKNSNRVIEQKKAPITVIMSNPPYSVGQRSKNDIAQNQVYNKLHKRIEETFVKSSKDLDADSKSLKKFYYDPYIKAFRWSIDRLSKNNEGIIAFVSNGGWLNSNSLDGFRKSIEKELAEIYVFNLRGNAQASGEFRKKEAGNVFGAGSRTPITIVLLVKKQNKNGTAQIHYHDIGDYLGREQKLKIISDFESISKLPLNIIRPNENGDWITQRSGLFDNFIDLAPVSKYDQKTNSFFVLNTNGVVSGRSNWVYNFSEQTLCNNINNTVNFFNSQIEQYAQKVKNNGNIDVKTFINTDESKIKWDDKLIGRVSKGKPLDYDSSCIREAYRTPFCKEMMYFNEHLNWSRVLLPKLFPDNKITNLVISCIGKGASRDFSVLISDLPMDYHFEQNGQCFPLYYYEEADTKNATLFDAIAGETHIRRDAVSDFILECCRSNYGPRVSKEDIFYYVYGILHSPDYRTRFASDLKKMLPRLPLVNEAKDFWAFSKAGRALANLHLNYETIEIDYELHNGIINLLPPTLAEYRLVAEPKADYWTQRDFELYRVDKMRFPSKNDKSKILYNSRITIENIPETAYQYIVNGKSAIEWIMERYQIVKHKESGITNDPNDWAIEHNDPKYILNLLLRVISLSMDTVKIVNNLPKMKFE